MRETNLALITAKDFEEPKSSISFTPQWVPLKYRTHTSSERYISMVKSSYKSIQLDLMLIKAYHQMMVMKHSEQ